MLKMVLNLKFLNLTRDKLDQTYFVVYFKKQKLKISINNTNIKVKFLH